MTPGRFRLGSLSRRRRALVAAVAALVAAVVAAATALLVTRVTAGGAAEDLPAQDRPGPVLLVPGYGGGTRALDVLAGQLRAAGRDATVVDLPEGGIGDLTRQADAVDDAAQAALRRGAPSVDVVGYSAGGVVARLWAADHDGTHKARRIVTLGSPHHGADLAAVGTVLAPGACPLACQQLAPGSRLLSQLNAAPVADHPAWMSVWTTGDDVVTPPDSARLDGAVNVVLQSVCSGVTVDHSGLPTSPLVTGIVLRALDAAPLTAPAATDCQALEALGR